MKATDIVAFAYAGDVYCVTCATRADDFDGFRQDAYPAWYPVFAGTEVDTPQACGQCGHDLDGYSVLTKTVRVQCTVERKLTVPLGINPHALAMLAGELGVELSAGLALCSSGLDDWEVVSACKEAP